MLTVAVLALAACSSEITPGPLEFGGGDGILCVRAGAGESVVIGDVAQAPPDADVTVEGMHLVDGAGVTSQEGFLIPLAEGVTPIGSASYPPRDDPAWAQRQRAEGAVIAAGTSANVVMVVQRVAQAEGTATAMQINYKSPEQHTKSNSTKYALKDRCE